MNYADCITALQEYADAPENAGVDNEFFINVVKFVKEQEDQIKLQVLMKEQQEEQMEDTLASLNFYQECNTELKQEIKELKSKSLKQVSKLYNEIKEFKLKLEKAVNAPSSIAYVGFL